MSYNSVYFVLFFALFLSVYLLMPKVWLRKCIILVGNVIFYVLAGSSECLAILVGTSLIVYGATRLMGWVYETYDHEKEGLTPKEQTQLLPKYKKRAKMYLLIAVFVVLGMLIYVKAGRMLGFEAVQSISQIRPKTFIVILGMSYYTFSAVGYMLDVYWRKAKCEKNYFNLILSMTYFPIIVQGPIMRYDKLMKQFDELPKFEYQRVCFGLQRMIWGFFKKMVVADRLYMYNNAVFSQLDQYGGVELWLAFIFNALALYADFSGCMDIVIGAAQTMGVTLQENFKQPFFSKGAAEFWRRWHITLGTWFKDYVYMPIAMNPKFMKFGIKVRKKFGNRAGQIASSAIPLAVVWILTGLWHGTGIDYFLWGCYWGILIILETVLTPEMKKLTEFFKIDVESFGWRFFQMARTFVLFGIGRMLTTTGTLAGFKTMLVNSFTQHKIWMLGNGKLTKIGFQGLDFWIAMMGILLIWGVDVLQQKYKLREELAKQPLVFRWVIYYGAILAVLILGIYGSAYDASSFVYGAF